MLPYDYDALLGSDQPLLRFAIHISMHKAPVHLPCILLASWHAGYPHYHAAGDLSPATTESPVSGREVQTRIDFQNPMTW